MEVYLTKEFERTPFLTAVYPYSELAKKTRILLYDLLHEERPDLVPRPYKGVTRWLLPVAKMAMGRTPAIFNVIIVTAVIATSFVLFQLSDSATSKEPWQSTLVNLGRKTQRLEVIAYLYRDPSALPRYCPDLPVGSEVACFQKLYGNYSGDSALEKLGWRNVRFLAGFFEDTQKKEIMWHALAARLNRQFAPAACNTGGI
jgi:hypothetical protein